MFQYRTARAMQRLAVFGAGGAFCAPFAERERALITRLQETTMGSFRKFDPAETLPEGDYLVRNRNREYIAVYVQQDCDIDRATGRLLHWQTFTDWNGIEIDPEHIEAIAAITEGAQP